MQKFCEGPGLNKAREREPTRLPFVDGRSRALIFSDVEEEAAAQCLAVALALAEERRPRGKFPRPVAVGTCS
jgi:hypothetical protein